MTDVAPAVAPSRFTDASTNVPATPSKGRGQGSLIGTQAGNRYTDTFFDQHKFSRDPRFGIGRPWCGPREMAANKGSPDGFVGELQCGHYVATGPEDDRHVPMQTPQDRLDSFATAWSAPWFPESKYFEFSWRTKRITIRYDRVLAEYTKEQRNYYLAANKIAVSKGWPELAFGGAPSFGIASVLGEPYARHSPKLPQAAQAGDPWLLGFTEDVNLALAKLLGYATDSTGVAVAAPYEPLPTVEPVAQVQRVETVLGADAATLAALIEQIMDARDQRKKDARMAHARAGKRA